MAILASIPEQVFTPRTVNANSAVPANTKRLVFSCTRVAWPSGPIGTIAVTRPDGSAGPQCGFEGGVVTKKDGGVATQSGMTLETTDGSDLPVGTYGVAIVVLQTITTAITVEGF